MGIEAVILIIISVPLLLFAGICVYVFVLLIRRPPLALYEQRSAQADFLALDGIPERLIRLLVAKEDPRFFTHHGYDLECIQQAWKRNFREKQIIFGGSTITQQLSRNLYLRFSKNYLRKITETLIALRLEHVLGKQRILEMYINIIYFGNGIYGIVEASRFYFNKSVPKLTLNQMLILISLLPAPTAGNPIQHPEVFLQLRSRNLNYFTTIDPPLISQDEAQNICAYGVECLDPELRQSDSFTRSYPQTIPLINERFGPFSMPEVIIQ